MKILVITRNAWDDTNAIGNTLSNFFSGINNIEFASVYFRSAMPNNKLCRRYYRTTEMEVAKNWFSPKKIGKQFYVQGKTNNCSREAPGKKEKVFVRLVQKHGVKAAYKLSDAIWYSKKWINQNLDSFIEDFAPDLMFAFVKAAPQYYLTIQYLREKYSIPLFSWIADDEYTGLVKRNATKEIDNLKYILQESSVVRGCSEEICEYYNERFSCNAIPLYKSCELSTPVKKETNVPVKIIYAGNLLYGRSEIICRIAQILEEISISGASVLFEIYSNTELLQSEIRELFGQLSCAKYMGRKDYNTIKKRLSEADLVLHVESFEEEQILKTRYSFSTKIIDCLQSGSVLLAVGPDELSSMRYIQRIPGAYIVNDLNKLPEELPRIIDDAPSFCDRANAMRSFARQYHDAAMKTREVEETIKKIVEGES